MNLNNVSVISFQGNLAKEAWLNGIQLLGLGTTETIWTFTTPPAGRTITGFSVSTTSGTILIDWGDSTSNTINSGSSVNKTY